jgi:hypothetical protein
MSGYIGTQPVPQATQTRDSFTATAGQTSFATAGYTPQFLDVYLNGSFLTNGDDFTATNGSDVVLATGATAGDTIEVVAYRTFEVSSISGGLTAANNLSDVINVATSRTNLGLGTTDTPTFGAITANGNITVTGTVDGRDVATDGTKLDTVATNADVTPSWVPAVDPSYLTAVGAGSVGTTELEDDGVSRAKLKDEVVLQILDSTGTALKTIYGAGS